MAVQTNEIAAVVLQKINADVPDALERETKFMSIVTGNQKKKQKGALFIQCPIKLIANASMGFISGTGSVLDMNTAQQLQYMVFNWKYFNHNVNFTLSDYNITGGAEEIVDFMETKIEGAANDAARTWSTTFNGGAGSYDYAGNAQTAKPTYFQGIVDICAASGVSYGALTDTDYATGAFLPIITTSSDFTAVTYNNFNAMATNLRLRIRGFGKSKKIIAHTNGYVYAKLKTALQNQQIFMNESDFIKAGFVGFSVDGVDVYPDADAPGSATAGTTDNWLMMWPEELISFWYNYGFGNKSKFDGEVRIPNQTIESYQTFTTGELICPNRRLIAVHKGF